MKKLVLVSALVLGLAACNEAETTTEAEVAEPAAEAETAAAAWPIQAGTYEYTRSDGVTGVNTLAADGTFSNAITGGDVETGTWGQEEGLSCFVPTGGGDKRCYTMTAPDAEGNFSGTRQDGVTVTGRKTA